MDKSTGPAVASQYKSFELDKFCFLLKRDIFSFWRVAVTFVRVHVGHQPKGMGDPAGAGGTRTQGASGVHSATWGTPRGGGRAGFWLKPEVNVAIAEDIPPRLDGDVATFEDMREFLVDYSECEQQRHITNHD